MKKKIIVPLLVLVLAFIILVVGVVSIFLVDTTLLENKILIIGCFVLSGILETESLFWMTEIEIQDLYARLKALEEKLK